MALTLFTLPYFVFSSTLLFKMGHTSDISSITIFAASLFLIGFVIVAYYFDPCPFGFFRFSFVRKFVQINHLLIYIYFLILSPLFIVVFPNLPYISFVPICLLLICTLIEAILTFYFKYSLYF